MKKYDSYKNSGIEWIGEIPSHWEVKKVKHLTRLQGGYAFKSDLFTSEGIPVIRIGDIADSINFEECKKIDDDTIPQEYRLEQFDTLIALSGATTGKTCFIGNVPPKAYVNQRVARILFSNKLLYYIINSGFFQEQILLTASGSAQENISNSQIENLEISISNSQKEQTAIAAYLDRKTAEIDELIADKKRLLELYEEEKAAIINQAVTKGINPNVPLKDSGIEWMGEIPEHWEVKRFKYYFNIITEKVEEDLPKIGLENIESKSGRFIETDTEFAGQGVRFRPKDILFGKLRPYLAKVWLSNFDGQAVGDFYVFRSKQDVIPEFAKYRILDSSFIEVTNSSTYGSKMPRVSWEFIADLPIAFPKIQEQESIVQHIEVECSIINAKKAKTEKLIELLTEYRTALISEVVTGKIKVIE